jgi:hypothetical protein
MSKRFDLLSRKIDRKLDPDDIMLDIMEVYDETELIPEVGKHYTFVYSPKTSDIIYDEYPLVAVFSVEKWGFKALNYHWGKMRNYTWVEVAGYLHTIPNEDVGKLRAVPYRNFKTSL